MTTSFLDINGVKTLWNKTKDLIKPSEYRVFINAEYQVTEVKMKGGWII